MRSGGDDSSFFMFLLHRRIKDPLLLVTNAFRFRCCLVRLVTMLRSNMVYSDFPLLDLWLGFGLGLLNKSIMRYNGNKNVWLPKLFDLFFLFCILFQWVLKGLWLISRLRGSWYLLRWKMDPSLLWLVTATLVTSPAHWLITDLSIQWWVHDESPDICPVLS